MFFFVFFLRFFVSPTAIKDPNSVNSTDDKFKDELKELANTKDQNNQEIKQVLNSPKMYPFSESSIKTLRSSNSSTKSPTKLSHNWLPSEEVGHNLTVGPHPSADWMRRLALEKTRKTSEPEVGSKEKGLSCYRSSDCIPKDSSSSDSDLLRSAPPWAKSKFRFSEKKPTSLQIPMSEIKPSSSSSPISLSTPDSASSSSGTSSKIIDTAEAAAKKQRIKRSLMKRARSVAIFSLKLKERRAIEGKLPEASKSKETVKPSWGTKPEGAIGGELGCVPIEMLISVDDVAKDMQRRQSPSN